MIEARNILRTFLLIVFGVIIVGYSAFELRAFFEGPSLTITTPLPGETIPATGTYIEGNALNVTFLYLNGRKIYTTEKGAFREYVLLPKGYNVITLEAVGKFNKEITRTIALISP